MTDGKSKQAIERISQAAALEGRTPFTFGPPVPVKPAHELFGEILLEVGQPEAARRQFETALLRAPQRALSLLGTLHGAAWATEPGSPCLRGVEKVWHKAGAPLLQAVDAHLNARH
jgi:hypothetical protein